MAIYYQVKVEQINTIVFDDILANSEKEACQVAEYDAEQEFADKKKKYKVTSQAFSQEDDKIFVATYRKPTRDIGDPVEPNYVNVYEVRANHKIERSSEWDSKPYYQLRYFSPKCEDYYHHVDAFYVEEFPYENEAFAKQAAYNWANGEKKLDLDYCGDSIPTGLGNGYGSYGRLK
ncbi:uncharacterized protein METZ01_LOCUS183883 [marine metagenome]|uniref:Uncharacterized protein n=1 Tax=marine metagenome TaxID=408172 RepID=A0A382CYT5_9ZZZZ